MRRPPPRSTRTDTLSPYTSRLRALRLTLTNRRISAPNTAYPRYIGGERNAPPEDCGGVPGFHQLLDAMSDPGHPDHADMHEWVGDYDPAFVDDAAIRAGLAVMASLSADVSHPLARARRAHRSSPDRKSVV